jgi:hypothetical protein
VSAALFIQPRPWRVSTALLLSLLAHALLLSVALGGQTFGLPGLNLPWKERRLGTNDLQILLAPAQPAPAEAPTTKAPDAMRAAVDKPALQHREVAAALIPSSTTPAAPPPPAPVMTAGQRPDVNLPIAPNAPPVRAPARTETRNVPPQGSEVPAAANTGEAVQKQLEQEARERALDQARIEREKQSAEKQRQAELMADAQRAAARQEQLRQDTVQAEQAARNEAARMALERQEHARQEDLRQERIRQDEMAQQDAARQEQERAEAARLEAGRKEAARQEQARLAQLEAARRMQTQQDTARQEATRREAARQDAAKQEAARQDALKQESARQDALKQEAARQDQARQDSMKQDQARQNAIKQEAARQDSARQEAAQQERAKQDQAQRERADQEAKREERLRAIGQQLNQEAAQRDAASNGPSRSLLPGISSLRRGWLLGRADPNADLVQYAEAMSRKIEMNMTFDMVREAVKQPHAQPLVTVAIRADGSVEKVTFVVSSGVPAIDDAIRKVVASQAPYAAFPPTLARQYDVIEIRRTWVFDTAIRLQ